MPLRYQDDPSCYAAGRAVGVTHQTVQRCLARASRFGVMAALDDSPRPGKEPEITVPARAWLVSLACRKAKEMGYYYLERRDPAFEAKMAEILRVDQEVAILRAARSNAAEFAPDAEAAVVEQTAPNVAFVSYDEKPGIQANSNTAPDLPAVAGKHACVARDHEFKRLGTLSLLAGIDLLTGQVYANVEDRHLTREFVGFLKKLDAAYPADTAIKLILDNHSAHVSKETNKWLAAQRDGRFNFVFTPKHGSWLNLVEGFFSKMARSVLRHIRVASKPELKQRIIAYLDDLNREPVVHTWSYKITLPAG